VTDIRFAFETLQHDDAKALGFAAEGPFAKAAIVRGGLRYYVLTAYGRCLRPALYSSLRSSPSHPTGVSALRVTIAIASARFARNQWAASRVLRVCWLGSWALGTSDRGGQDKSRKVRPVGRLEDGSNFSHAPNIANIQRNLPFLIARCFPSVFDTLWKNR